MPSYKLTYFNGTGKGEPIRWLLSYMDIDFEDCRCPNMEQWLSLKKEILFGKVPVLDIDGKRMYQSEAIYRYLGKQAKLAGSNDLENQQIDAIVGTLGDLGAGIGPARMESNPEKKAQILAKLKEETIPYYMKIYNDIAKDGYLANGKLSWADIVFVAMEDTLEALLGVTLLENYPNLNALKEKITSLPGIKKWLEKRPKN